MKDKTWSWDYYDSLVFVLPQNQKCLDKVYLVCFPRPAQDKKTKKSERR